MNINNRQSISASGEIPQELPQVKAGSLETKQALSPLGKIGAAIVSPLAFSFRSLVSKMGITPGGPANQASSSGKAQKLPQASSQTAPKGVLSKPAIDVKTLQGQEGQNVKNKVEKYDDLRGAALRMLSPSGGKSSQAGWKPLSSSKSNLPSSVEEPARETFKELKRELEAMGFKAGGANDEGFYHEASGTRIAILCHEDTQEISIFVEGLQSPGSKGFGTRLKEIVADSLGLPSASRDLAVKLGETLKEVSEKSPNQKMSIVGHSHGGSIAQTAALVGGVDAVCFNSRRVGGKTQEKIGQENIANNEGKITHFNKPDFLTKRGGVVSLLVKAGNAVSFGNEYSIPLREGAKGPIQRHNDTQWPSNLNYTVDSQKKNPEDVSLHNRNPAPEELQELMNRPPPPQAMNHKARKMMLDLGN